MKKAYRQHLRPVAWGRGLLVLMAGVVCALALRAEALEPGEILLVVNQNVPESGKLAEFYQAARLIPKGRIVSLNLPATEDVACSMYEREVVYPIRQFLRKNELQEKVKCVVTFYGVPLRVGVRTVTAEEKLEAEDLARRENGLLGQVRAAVEKLENQTRRLDGRFEAERGEDLAAMGRRAQAAWDALSRPINEAKDAESRGQRLKVVVDSVRELHGRGGLLRVLGTNGGDAAGVKSIREEFEKAAAELAGLQDKLFDPATRGRMRKLVTEAFGLLEQARLTQVQREYLTPGSTVAALDSELALVWWDSHPRKGWQTNPLYYRAGGDAGGPRMMMVMRLDAPQSGQVREMILSSLKAERDGLKGRVVLDSRGIHSRVDEQKLGTYAWYDQSIRDLGELIRTKTKLGLLHDESPGVLAEGSAGDVALYCGWYSVRNYVPSCRLNGGAVGFHVASFELVSLRNANERGWCAGLLNDGVAATLGPVAEPYLPAFPAADDFFPLLLTGKLTLAEVYWKTAPTAGWMMSMIGDPLYRPYGARPALRVEDLPVRLRGVVARPTTLPSTGVAR